MLNCRCYRFSIIEFMLTMRYLSCLLFIIALTTACKNFVAKPYDFPNPVDTTTRVIEFQEKKTYAVSDVYASNEFDGARLNNFQPKGKNSFVATIRPENSPINPSPWYAFKIWTAAGAVALLLNLLIGYAALEVSNRL